VPGLTADFHLDTSAADAAMHYRATEYGPVPEAGLILGKTLEHGLVRLECDDPAAYDVLAEKAMRLATFLRQNQRNGLAA
jgi:hypothetical protein